MRFCRLYLYWHVSRAAGMSAGGWESTSYAECADTYLFLSVFSVPRMVLTSYVKYIQMY